MTYLSQSTCACERPLRPMVYIGTVSATDCKIADNVGYIRITPQIIINRLQKIENFSGRKFVYIGVFGKTVDGTEVPVKYMIIKHIARNTYTYDNNGNFYEFVGDKYDKIFYRFQVAKKIIGIFKNLQCDLESSNIMITSDDADVDEIGNESESESESESNVSQVQMHVTCLLKDDTPYLDVYIRADNTHYKTKGTTLVGSSLLGWVPGELPNRIRFYDDSDNLVHAVPTMEFSCNGQSKVYSDAEKRNTMNQEVPALAPTPANQISFYTVQGTVKSAQKGLKGLGSLKGF